MELIKERIKIALVSTKGGHFEQLTNLSDLYNRYDHFWITNKNNQTESVLINESKYYINIAHYKRPWTYLFQLYPIIKILYKEKPTHILSTGSGRTAFVPYILSKIMKIKFLYIDTFSRVNGYSKFGSFLLKIGNPVFSQWEDHKNDNIIFIGPVFKKIKHSYKDTKSDYIFVTVGTREEKFIRLIECIEKLKKEGLIKYKIIVQAGNTTYHSKKMEIFNYCSSEKIDKLIMNAKFVITQESAGISTICLKHKTKFIVMPRDYKYGELPTKSDMKEDLHFKLEDMGFTIVVNNILEMKNAIMQIDNLKTGFCFDNKLAINKLTQYIEIPS